MPSLSSKPAGKACWPKRPDPARSAPHQPPALWVQAPEALLASPAAAKMPGRRQRNPALEYAFRRFDEAQLTTLEPLETAAK
ncbi:hypothetical protein GCM10022408_09400 [Hymenobacter fastidiosus]|uniref:Uncharacterized protein n=1 Tax=Hymenobacter fastidiosus TaxID=486264 RepID=A0ABP7RPI2_9BACT